MTLRVTPVLILLLALTALHAEEQLRIAIQPYPIYGPIFIVKQKGWLEEELKAAGVSVVWSSFNAGPQVNEAFAAGTQDIGVVGDSPALVARSAGQDNRIIGLTANGPTALALVVPVKSPITTLAQLKGRKVSAVKGSYGHHLLFLGLEKGGLGTGDVEIVNLTHSDIGIALQKGEIDAGVLWEPLLTRLVDEGAVRVLADGSTLGKKGLLVSVATQAFIARHPELVVAYLKAYQRGNALIKASPKEAAGLVAREVKLSAAQLEKVFTKFDYSPAIRADDIAELKKSADFSLKSGIIRQAVDVDGFVDLRHLVAAGIP